MTIVVETGRDAHDVMLEHCEPLSDRDLGRLHRAGHVAEVWHESQFRATGERYITHTNGVEHILVVGGYERDITMRVAAKLHDVIEDCKPEDRDRLRLVIRKRFGKIAIMIVEAVTKKDGCDPATQLLKAVAKWWRVGLWRAVLLKLADTLFNLSTIEGFNNYRREMRQFGKAAHMLEVALIPCQRFIPKNQRASYDSLLADVTALLRVKRLESMARERESDLGYFPTL